MTQEKTNEEQIFYKVKIIQRGYKNICFFNSSGEFLFEKIAINEDIFKEMIKGSICLE